MTDVELLAEFNNRWKKGWSDGIKIVREDYSEENYRRLGERYLLDYYKKHYPFDQGRILGLETQNFLSLDEEGKYKYHVRIDRLMDRGGGLYEVHDYKTNMTLPSQKDLDEDRQLAMYSIWVRQRFKDFKKVRLVWHFLAFNKEMESFRTAEELEKLRQDRLTRIYEIEREEGFPPKENNFCGWCLYQSICPLWKHTAKVDSLPENEFLGDPGVQLVDEYIRIREDMDRIQKESGARLDKIKEALQEFCKAEGVAQVAGTRHTIRVTESNRIGFPPKNSSRRDRLIEILRDASRLEEVSDLDVHRLGRILQDGQSGWEDILLKELEKYASYKKDVRFNIRKRDR